jgi:hypothetical protein
MGSERGCNDPLVTVDTTTTHEVPMVRSVPVRLAVAAILGMVFPGACAGGAPGADAFPTTIRSEPGHCQLADGAPGDCPPDRCAPGDGVAPDAAPMPWPEPYGGMVPDPAGRGLSTASCASSSCHGGPRGGNHASHTFAATTWVTTDPHAGAYETLFEPRSVRMARLLGIGPPHTERQCLVCHSVQEAAPDPLPPAVLADGAGCASCHGDATGWLEAHSQADWKRLSAAEKRAVGFRDLSGPLGRARECARCHVGDADHDMHHDHVAAGHPRLLFELAQLQRRWPRHWDPRGRAETEPDFQARSWAVGQAVALEAAATLLAARASRAAAAVKTGAPTRWPEYTEFDCQACHRDLTRAEALTDAAPLPRRLPPGTPGWQPWFVTGSGLLDAGLATPSSADGAELAGQVSALRANLAREWLAIDAARIEQIAAEARGVVRGARRTAETLAAAPDIRVAADGGRLDRLAATDPRLWRSWDAAVQMTLALEADRRGGPATLGVQHPGDRSHPLDRLRESLLYPLGFDAPVGFDPERFHQRRADVP